MTSEQTSKSTETETTNEQEQHDKECYIAFRIEFTITDDDINYQFRMCTSKTPFKKTDTAEDLDNKMINTSEIRWMEMIKNCKGYFKTITGEEYFIKYTTLKYGQILKQLRQC